MNYTTKQELVYFMPKKNCKQTIINKKYNTRMYVPATTITTIEVKSGRTFTFNFILQTYELIALHT